MRDTGQMTRAAILLTLALIFQSLRFIIPLPPFLSVFLIGVLVNAVLAFAAWRISLGYILGFSVVLPVVAYLQGQLPIPILIPVVVAGNWVYVVVLKHFAAADYRRYLAPLAKAAVMYGSTMLVLQLFSLPPMLQATLGMMMGIAQLVTGIIGIWLAGLATHIVR